MMRYYDLIVVEVLNDEHVGEHRVHTIETLSTLDEIDRIVDEALAYVGRLFEFIGERNDN